MKIKTFSIITALALIISACGAQVTPTITGADVQGTANVMASTLIAQTQAAIPTNTSLPPTEAFTQTLEPTNTLEPSPTLQNLVLASPTPTIITLLTDLPTFTPAPATGSNPCDQPLLSWLGKTTTFTLVNETNPKGKIILLMSVTTLNGECGWLHIYSDSFSGPVGTYSAGAFVNGKKNFKVFGVFKVTEGAWKVIVRNDVIVAKGICYPNC